MTRDQPEERVKQNEFSIMVQLSREDADELRMCAMEEVGIR